MFLVLPFLQFIPHTTAKIAFAICALKNSHHCWSFLKWKGGSRGWGYMLISSSILGTYQPGDFIFKCPNSLPFHSVHGVLKARILKWFAIPFSSGPRLSELFTVIPLSWVATLSMTHSFIELEKAVVHVINLVCFL